MTESNRTHSNFSASDAPRTRITGVGAEVPSNVVTTAEVEEQARICERFGLEAGWLEHVTGVRERRWADPNVTPTQLATSAGAKALEDAGHDPLEIDTLIYAGITRECLEPAAANLVAEGLGASNARVFDVINACNSLIDGVDMADSLIRSGKARRVLVTTGERASIAMDWDPKTIEEMLRSVAGLVVGDGGGAFVIEPSDDPERGFLQREFRSDSSQWRHAIGGWFGFGERSDGTRASEFDHRFRCDGKSLLSAAISLLGPTMQAVMDKTGWSYDDLDIVFCHQPTKRFVEWATPVIGDARDALPKLWGLAEYYGNMSTCSTPVAFSQAREAGKLVAGSKALVLAPSSGVSVAGLTMVW